MGWHEHGPKTWARSPAQHENNWAVLARHEGRAGPCLRFRPIVPPGTARCPGPCLGRPGTKKHEKGPASARLLPNNPTPKSLGSDAQYRPNPTRSPLHRATAAQRRRRPGASGGRMADPGLQVCRRPASSTGRKGRRRARIQGGRKPSTAAAHRRRLERSSPRQAPPATSGWSP